MSRYTINGLPWASGLGKDVKDCKTAREVMEKAGLNWGVEKCELVARMPFRLNGDNDINETMGDFAHKGNIYRNCPNGFGTYRTDKNIPLGIVKQKYEVVQNIDVFNFFDEAIGENKAIWQSAGCLGYGHKIFVTAKLPIETTVNGDRIDNYLVFSNSHDGSSSIDIMFTPIRVACTNMLNAGYDKSEAHIRIIHTSSASTRLSRGAAVLKSAIECAKDSESIYNALYTIKMNDDQVMEYLCRLVLSDSEFNLLKEYDPKNGCKKLMYKDYLTMENTNISTRKANQLAQMFGYYLDGIGQKEINGTAWGAYNAVTGFYCNVANLEGEKRLDSLVWGSAYNNMNKALNNTELYREVA